MLAAIFDFFSFPSDPSAHFLVQKFRVARFFWGQHTKMGKNMYTKKCIRNGLKISQMAVKLTKCPQNTPKSSFPSSSKIYPNWDFWLESMPSGNPCAKSRETATSKFAPHTPSPSGYGTNLSFRHHRLLVRLTNSAAA
jgi:hypothetical protein